MKPLDKMTLLELASAVACADNGPDHDRYTQEIVRRQRMLDAAEVLYSRRFDSEPYEALFEFAESYAEGN